MLYKKLVQRVCLTSTLALSCLAVAQARDADTLTLTITETDNLFLTKNLQLIAKHFGVLADSALISQARLWDNPNLNTDQNVYANKRFFDHGTTENGNPKGQYFLQIEQLIRTAGKRGKQIKLAATNATITHWQLYDLMRNLKYQLHTDFYTIVQLELNQQLYQRQILQLDKLLAGMEAQFNAGNVARKDVLRVQALRVNTDLESAANSRKLSDVQTELVNMLQLPGDTYVMPVVTTADAYPLLPAQSPDQLIADARNTNSAYQLQQFQLQYQRQNLAYQKALAVPDVLLAPNFDRQSNFTVNYWGLGINFALPFLNRNQGNIRAAHYQIQQEEAGLSQAELELQNNLLNAYRKLQFSINLNNLQQQEFYRNYAQQYNKVLESYNARQISLLEFIDYFNDYEDVRKKQLQQELDVRLAKEELNYQAGVEIIK